MASIIIAPAKYAQGKDEIHNLGGYIKNYGSKSLILVSDSGMKRVGSVIQDSLTASSVESVFECFQGECCKIEVDRLIEIYQENQCDNVIGVGGGKILDTAKAVAYYKKCPVAIVPTIASTDAPCSALTVLYTPEGQFEEYLFLPSNPNLVLVDTNIIVNAPARLLVAGMGDALATYFEARACFASNAGTCAGGTSTIAALGLAKLCYETLLKDGYLAKVAIENKVCSKPVEHVIEANTLLSGMGFESGGLAGAHAIHNGFTVIPETHSLYHGEKVAFGTITQLVLEDAPMEEIKTVVHFCKTIGLPTTLTDLGMKDSTKEEIMAVAKASSVEGETIHNMPFKVTAEDVYCAILVADSLGKTL